MLNALYISNNENIKHKGDKIMRTTEKNKTTIILQHAISYYYDNHQEMPEGEQEHVQKMIIEGYSSGELNDDENRGWWAIVSA